MYTWHCHHFPASALIKGNSRQRTTEITEATEAVLNYRFRTPLPFAAKPKRRIFVCVLGSEVSYLKE